MTERSIDKETVRALVEGTIRWEDATRLMRLYPKDEGRFWTYLEVLQDKVPWDDKILLRIADHLYVARKKDGSRVVKCDCGHEFGDYRVNWKLSAVIRVRKTPEQFAEIYKPPEACPDPEFQEIREFFCPGCCAQLAVEVVPQGDPLLFDFLPDIDALYRDWLGKPLEDERPDWFQDRTNDMTAQWAQEKD